MTINIPNVKKKILAQFDKTIKAAANRAIPIVKKEAFKQITDTSTNYDAIVKFVTTGILLVVVLHSNDGLRSPSATKIPTAQTIINIDTLNLWR